MLGNGGLGEDQSPARQLLEASFAISSMHKPRLQSPLHRLPLDQRQSLHAWLTTGGEHGIGMTYDQAIKKLQAEFGLKVSRCALSRYYTRYIKLSKPVQVETTSDGKSIHITINLQ